MEVDPSRTSVDTLAILISYLNGERFSFLFLLVQMLIHDLDSSEVSVYLEESLSEKG